MGRVGSGPAIGGLQLLQQRTGSGARGVGGEGSLNGLAGRVEAPEIA